MSRRFQTSDLRQLDFSAASTENKERIWIYVFYNENTDADIKIYLEKLKGKLLSEIEKMFGIKSERKQLKAYSSSPAIMKSNEGGYKIKKLIKRKKKKIRIKTRRKK